MDRNTTFANLNHVFEDTDLSDVDQWEIDSGIGPEEPADVLGGIRRNIVRRVETMNQRDTRRTSGESRGPNRIAEVPSVAGSTAAP